MTRFHRRTVMVMLATSATGAVAWALWRGTHPDLATLARRAYDRADWSRAEVLLRSELRPDRIWSADRDEVRLYARTLTRLGRDAAAKTLYDGRLASTEMEPEDLFLKGLTLTREGKLEAAFKLWGRSMAPDVDHPEMLDHYARLGARLQQFDLALEAARRLSQMPGWETRGRFILGSISEILDDPPGVVEALTEALRRDPEARGAPFDPTHYRKLLARNLLRLDRGAEAGKTLNAITMADTEADWLRSRAYLQQGQMVEATSALTRSGSYGSEHRITPEPAAYIGESACVPCHRDVTRHYETTRHARTFTRGAGLLDLPRTDRPVPDPDDPKVHHEVVREGDRVEVKTNLGDRVSRMVVEYAFGLPDHYLTMTTRDDHRHYRALRISHYKERNTSGWGATAGDVGHSNNPDDRIGQKIDVRDGVMRCLYCHVTRSRDFRDPAPAGGPSASASDRSIGCERCHGPGGNHLRAIDHDFQDAKGSFDYAISSVPASAGMAASGSCIECHTVGLPHEIARNPDDPRYVRSPGATFSASRCVTESNGAMSCLTCHDPHGEANHSAAFYEAKCLNCHAASTQSSAPKAARCPVNPVKNCLDCHMPKIPRPELHSKLTDHFIRIHREPSSRTRIGEPGS